MKLITKHELAYKLKVCGRTIDRVRDEGRLFPCSLEPIEFNQKDVVTFLNSCAKGMCSTLDHIPDDFFTQSEVATAIDVKLATLRNWVRRAETKEDIPHYRMSKTWVLLRMEDVGRWLLNQTKRIEKEHQARRRRIASVKRRMTELKQAKNCACRHR